MKEKRGGGGGGGSGRSSKRENQELVLYVFWVYIVGCSGGVLVCGVTSLLML